jgi:hypothetical protein
MQITECDAKGNHPSKTMHSGNCVISFAGNLTAITFPNGCNAAAGLLSLQLTHVPTHRHACAPPFQVNHIPSPQTLALLSTVSSPPALLF